ncbi:MAG: hypothetical protein ACTSSG_11260 [Candidatus Heimdallarchaeaceae archaeon]
MDKNNLDYEGLGINLKEIIESIKELETVIVNAYEKDIDPINFLVALNELSKKEEMTIELIAKTLLC